MANPFDAFRHEEKLTAAGVPVWHAKAQSEALATALKESDSMPRVGKHELALIQLEMIEAASELKLMKGMIILVLAGVISLIAKTFL
jgi:hypothetical protein